MSVQAKLGVVRYRYSTNRLHQENRILQIKHIHELYILASVFRCLKDTPIEPFKDCFTRRRGGGHEHNLRNNQHLSSNQIFLNTGKTTTHTNGTVLWNNCPASITDLNDIGSFKKVCLNIILKRTKNKLSAYTAYAAMFVVRDRVPNLITNLLTANTDNINGRTQCKHTSEMGFSVARQVDTPHKQWTLHEYHYILHLFNKYRWLNAGVTDFSNTRENSCVFLHWAIDMLLHFALY